MAKGGAQATDLAKGAASESVIVGGAYLLSSLVGWCARKFWRASKCLCGTKSFYTQTTWKIGFWAAAEAL